MNVRQYVEAVRILAYALPAYRSVISINIGIVCAALVNHAHRCSGQTGWRLHDTAGRRPGRSPFARDREEGTGTLLRRG